MKNILRDGDKSEVIKIMPFGKTVALALLLTLSGCKETGEKTPIPMWNTTVDLHNDYLVEEKPCQDSSSFAWCTEKRVILKKDGEGIYVRADLDSNWVPVLYVGSYDENDSIESEIGNDVLKIQNQ